MRSLFAWAIGLITAMLLVWIGTEALASLGVPTWIDFGETVTVQRGSGPTGYEEEIDGESTTPGTILAALAIMIAARIGIWIYRQAQRRSERPTRTTVSGLAPWSCVVRRSVNGIGDRC